MSDHTEVTLTLDDTEIQHFRLGQSAAVGCAVGFPMQMARKELHKELQLFCAQT